MKILIIGSGRHGKDTVAEIIKNIYGYSYTSSSFFKRLDVFNFIKDKYPELNYSNVDECYNDRGNHRDIWSEYLDNYSAQDKTRLTREILEEYDIYVGMRNYSEFKPSKSLFDMIIYVDASKRVKYIDKSMEIPIDEATHIIYNNENLKELKKRVEDIF